jgi:hypothetical protein
MSEIPPIPPFEDVSMPDGIREETARAIADSVELAALEGADPGAVGALVAREDERSDRWRIENDGAAEWALRKYAAADDEIAQAKLRAEVWHRQIEDWLAERIARPAATRAFFAELLGDYALRVREETGRATLTLPSGAVPTRDEKPKAVVVDERAFIEWAREELREAVKESPLVSNLRKHSVIVEVETGRTAIDLSCGHGIIDSTAQPVGLGERILCSACGEPEAVVAVGPEKAPRVAVIEGDDRILPPGVGVDPGGVQVGSIRLTGR